MTDPSDADLVRRCQAGSDAAFAELVDRYQRLVFGVISQTVADRSRVEDLAQEVFLKVHRGLPGFRGDAKLSTWIYRILLNVCSEARRQDGTAARSVSLSETDENGTLTYEVGATDRAFNDLELRDELERAIAQLPTPWRLLISAHYFGGQQYQELAEIFDVPIGTVKTYLHRAKKRLRVILEQGAST
jgi:RNA polymerase sigma-70 factor (ECF subfamily)